MCLSIYLQGHWTLCSEHYGSHNITSYKPSELAASYETAPSDITLERFNKIADEDVEMQVCGMFLLQLYQPPLVEQATFLVVDTNILIHHLDTLVQFVVDVEKYDAPVVVIVPGVVINELDGHKKNRDLKWYISTASTWLLKKVREHKKVRGQGTKETLRKSGNWRVKSSDDVILDRLNDYLILDCCLYFSRIKRTILWSADYNLCIEAQSEGIETVENTPGDRKKWSSLFVVRSLFPGLDESRVRFESKKVASLNRKTKLVDDGAVNPVATTDSDAMDVDSSGQDDEDEIMSRSDSRDRLHEQVRAHFTTLLQETVYLNGRDEIEQVQSRHGTPSMHAPAWHKNRKPVAQWTASECVSWLDSKKKCLATQPRLDVFLQAPRSGRGSRVGREWSRADWHKILVALRKIGEDWEDSILLENVDALSTMVEFVYDQPFA
ncbi:hypothetical protein CYLTODRAFT_396174 [Cylindrobasidium torrendii FP15055 ss-10]|uniref:PIN domain-containing protein n=1 Tax=Cylindrobasidium torrendii FP15055 ss-10 TaxID=1314674 RepID=A0A0D7BCG5_9AGAR|nr:hypothetical protein CYLTODRAFT_396174 [Cylindrobasidium torrendii FP15055 ss-10]